MPLSYKPSAELPDEEYPAPAHHRPQPLPLPHQHDDPPRGRAWRCWTIASCCRIHPQDAAQLGLPSRVRRSESVSRRGEMTAEADVTDICPPGVVSMTFHFAESPTNVLTNPALDPVAKIPETKVCAVKVELV